MYFLQAVAIMENCIAAQFNLSLVFNLVLFADFKLKSSAFHVLVHSFNFHCFTSP